jgi:hypothetical protein
MNLTYREQKILLRETAAWHRAERRRKVLIAIVVVGAFAALLLMGECGLPTHGRGC